ncbi:MAG: hypothetical protein F6K21_29125 [Symploca sp. SIO2D2]|nr:hypothetical protein [Symploca sp. SIO2D2]
MGQLLVRRFSNAHYFQTRINRFIQQAPSSSTDAVEEILATILVVKPAVAWVKL